MREGGRKVEEGGREGNAFRSLITIRVKEYFLTSALNCFDIKDTVFNLILVTSPEKLLINILEITQCIKKRMFDRLAVKPHRFRRCS